MAMMSAKSDSEGRGSNLAAKKDFDLKARLPAAP